MEMRNKKAQVEIMGIALVVVLITIGIVFVAKYSAKEPKKTQEEFQRRELPKTIITSIVEVVSTCNDEKMADVMQDCGVTKQLPCEGFVNSCAYLTTTLKTILDDMLGRFEYDYQLQLHAEGQGDLLNDGTGGVQSAGFETECTTFETATQPLINGLTLELKVCY